jgi:hypothetical protein|tara:strand:+ start:80 stop:394 length:315 start_codon:yes stop_codon:yes gene_type:complete
MKRDVTAMVNKIAQLKIKPAERKHSESKPRKGKYSFLKGLKEFIMDLVIRINQLKKHREAEFDKSQFKTRIDFKLWIDDELKKRGDLKKLKAHVSDQRLSLGIG